MGSIFSVGYRPQGIKAVGQFGAGQLTQRAAAESAARSRNIDVRTGESIPGQNVIPGMTYASSIAAAAVTSPTIAPGSKSALALTAEQTSQLKRSGYSGSVAKVTPTELSIMSPKFQAKAEAALKTASLAERQPLAQAIAKSMEKQGYSPAITAAKGAVGAAAILGGSYLAVQAAPIVAKAAARMLGTKTASATIGGVKVDYKRALKAVGGAAAVAGLGYAGEQLAEKLGVRGGAGFFGARPASKGKRGSSLFTKRGLKQLKKIKKFKKQYRKYASAVGYKVCGIKR